MSDPIEVILHDGKSITVDMNRVSIKEWRSLVGCSEEEEYIILAKIFGTTPDIVAGLSFLDFRKLVKVAGEASRGEYQDGNPS